MNVKRRIVENDELVFQIICVNLKKWPMRNF
jgi:hypothetical protein